MEFQMMTRVAKQANISFTMGKPYGIAIIDIDFFIRFCRKFDQSEINHIIKNITVFFETQLPPDAIITKSNGDEYLVFAARYNKAELSQLMESIKKDFHKQRFAKDSSKEFANVAMTFSAGVASFPHDGFLLDDVLKKATVALFLAKALRRDRIVKAFDTVKTNDKRKLYNENLKVKVILGTYGKVGSINKKVKASEALLWEPQSIAADKDGNVYIADQNNHSVLQYNGEYVFRIIGNGQYGYSGNRGPGIKAALNKPTGLAIHRNHVYITDTGNDVVRKYNISKDLIKTIAGNGQAGYSGDGGKARYAALNKPGGITVDKKGNVFINDIANNVIRKVDKKGIITTYAGTGEYGYSGDGGSAADATFAEIYGIYIDRHDYLYVADYFNHCIRRIDLNNDIITTVAGCGKEGYEGDDGDASCALLSRPVAVCTDKKGNIFIAESGNSCIRFVEAGTNKIYTLVGDGVAGTGKPGRVGEFRLANPNGVAMGKNDQLFILDGANNRICLMALGWKKFSHRNRARSKD